MLLTWVSGAGRPFSAAASRSGSVTSRRRWAAENIQSTYGRWGATIKVMFRQTLHTARPAVAGVLRAAALSSSYGARPVAAALATDAAPATDAALAAAASVAAGGARG